MTNRLGNSSRSINDIYSSRLLSRLPNYLIQPNSSYTGDSSELINYVNPTTISIVACLLEKLSESLLPFNDWSDSNQYNSEFQLDTLFGDVKDYFALNQGELLKGFFRFKGTQTDLDYILHTSGYDIQIKDGDWYSIDSFLQILQRDEYFDVFRDILENSGLTDSELNERFEKILWEIYPRKVDNREPNLEIDNSKDWLVVNYDLTITGEEFFERLDLPNFTPTDLQLELIVEAIQAWKDCQYIDQSDYDCYLMVEVSIDLDDPEIDDPIFSGLDITGVKKVLEAIIGSRLSICTKMKSILIILRARDIWNMSRIEDITQIYLLLRWFEEGLKTSIEEHRHIDITIGGDNGVLDEYRGRGLWIDNQMPHYMSNTVMNHYLNSNIDPNLYINNNYPHIIHPNGIAIPGDSADYLYGTNPETNETYRKKWYYVDNNYPIDVYGNEPDPIQNLILYNYDNPPEFEQHKLYSESPTIPLPGRVLDEKYQLNDIEFGTYFMVPGDNVPPFDQEYNNKDHTDDIIADAEYLPCVTYGVHQHFHPTNIGNGQFIYEHHIYENLYVDNNNPHIVTGDIIDSTIYVPGTLYDESNKVLTRFWNLPWPMPGSIPLDKGRLIEDLINLIFQIYQIDQYYPLDHIYDVTPHWLYGEIGLTDFLDSTYNIYVDNVNQGKVRNDIVRYVPGRYMDYVIEDRHIDMVNTWEDDYVRSLLYVDNNDPHIVTGDITDSTIYVPGDLYGEVYDIFEAAVLASDTVDRVEIPPDRRSPEITRTTVDIYTKCRNLILYNTNQLDKYPRWEMHELEGDSSDRSIPPYIQEGMIILPGQIIDAICRDADFKVIQIKDGIETEL